LSLQEKKGNCNFISLTATIVIKTGETELKTLTVDDILTAFDNEKYKTSSNAFGNNITIVCNKK